MKILFIFFYNIIKSIVVTQRCYFIFVFLDRFSSQNINLIWEMYSINTQLSQANQWYNFSGCFERCLTRLPNHRKRRVRVQGTQRSYRTWIVIRTYGLLYQQT